MNAITINETALTVKEYQGKRVVTFKDIDTVHGRPEGTARRNFNTNKAHFIEGEDFFKVCADEIRTHKIMEISPKAQEDVTFITESGYLMLVKSFTDDLAWTVQRQLVNSYFRVKQMQTAFADLSPQLQLLINIETKQREQERAIAETNRRIDSIGEVIALDVHSWRKDAQHLISKIATVNGGFDSMKDIYSEIYRLVEERAGVSLGTRLTNKRRRMADEGVCKSKRDKLTKVDIIADDKKLIEIYLAIVKEMAVKSGVDMTAETVSE
jgi:hypothetical protein